MKTIACIECHNRSPAVETCQHCMGRGEEPVKGCPREEVTPDVVLAIETADDLEHHAGWPHGGGWLNEPLILVEATRYARNLTAIAKATYSRRQF